YETREALLRHLSAYDVAKLDIAFHHILSDTEKRTYLNPIRDLLWDIAETEVLLQEGMKLLLLGKDRLALKGRLYDTEGYLKSYGHRKLKVYLLGIFPLQEKTTTSLDRMIRFSINGEASQSRILQDENDLRRIEERLFVYGWSLQRTFLMAFGAPTDLSSSDSKGFWYKVPNIPDRTVELRVYVPSFHDRIFERVELPVSEIPRLSG
ncbi:uncharacterized protein CC84DRAFT_1055351, partial [Paraphaeosphaeria sporulosa]